MSNNSSRRILSDKKNIANDFGLGIFGEPLPDKLNTWKAILLGPSDTIWDGGIFKLAVEFPVDYPTKPPTVKFLTPMFHPNIYTDGKICLDILDKSWGPMYNLSGILISLQQLLTDPNPTSPANAYASRLYDEDRDEYNKLVYNCVENSWSI